MVQKLPRHDASMSSFSYKTLEISDGFATCAHVMQKTVGEMVDLVIRPTVVEPAISKHVEAFLKVHGWDMDGTATWPLFLWRFDAEEVLVGSTCILRGMKVVMDTYKCQWTDAFVPYQDLRKKLDCSFRTAIENVSDVPEITKHFW